MNLPWAPLFSLNRSDAPEITVYGIVSVVEGLSHVPLVQVGETHTSLWSRSLLKPWQLATLLPVLHRHYPTLTSRHTAIMLSSHMGEEEQVELLEDIMTMGQLSVDQLHCPACYPMSSVRQYELKAKYQPTSPLYNPCSGKHLGMLLALQAQQHELPHYLECNATHYNDLKQALSTWIGRETETFYHTVDGCGMPNYGLTAAEMAGMFAQLANTAEVTTLESVSPEPPQVMGYIQHVMRQYPYIVGGQGRLDSRLMDGKLTAIPLIAKEGADGLLGVGILPNAAYPQGMGILIKLSSGYEPRYLEITIRHILHQLGVPRSDSPHESGHPAVSLQMHFDIPQRVWVQ